MECPFCKSDNFEGNRCLTCGMNKDSFNPPPSPTLEKEVKVEAKPEAKRSHKKKG